MDFLKFVLKVMEREPVFNLLIVIVSLAAFAVFVITSGVFSSSGVDYSFLLTIFVFFIAVPLLVVHVIYSVAIIWLYSFILSKAQFKVISQSSIEVMRARLIHLFTEWKYDITILEQPSFPIERIVLRLVRGKKGIPILIYAQLPFVAIETYDNSGQMQVSIYTEDTLEGRTLGKHLETTLKHS